MSAFNRSELVAQNDFRLFEFDPTGEEGKVEYLIPLDERASAVIFLLEGAGGEAVALLDGTSLASPEVGASMREVGTRRLYFKKIQNRVQELLIKARATVGSTLKISVLVVFRLAKRVWSKLSCPACKRFIRFLISALLAGLGIPDLPANGLLPDNVWNTLLEFTKDPGDAPEIVQQILGQLDNELVTAFIDGIRWLSSAVNLIFEPLDALITQLCKYLRFCH